MIAPPALYAGYPNSSVFRKWSYGWSIANDGSPEGKLKSGNKLGKAKGGIRLFKHEQYGVPGVTSLNHGDYRHGRRKERVTLKYGTTSSAGFSNTPQGGNLLFSDGSVSWSTKLELITNGNNVSPWYSIAVVPED
jgi:hypothetical protein